MQRSGGLSEVAKHELCGWIAQMANWEVFGTFTFSRPRGLYEAARFYESFMDRVCPRVSHFYAVEQNPGGPGHHIHSLWADCSDVERKSVWKQWFHQAGRNRIEPVRNHQAVWNYSVKYVTKEGAWWWFRLNKPELAARMQAA